MDWLLNALFVLAGVASVGYTIFLLVRMQRRALARMRASKREGPKPPKDQAPVSD